MDEIVCYITENPNILVYVMYILKIIKYSESILKPLQTKWKNKQENIKL